jgi:hypothetical protein
LAKVQGTGGMDGVRGMARDGSAAEEGVKSRVWSMVGIARSCCTQKGQLQIAARLELLRRFSPRAGFRLLLAQPARGLAPDDNSVFPAN